jgi:hypothetical protein
MVRDNRIRVRFIQEHSGFTVGSIAPFPPTQAIKLIKMGVAERADVPEMGIISAAVTKGKPGFWRRLFGGKA